MTTKQVLQWLKNLTEDDILEGDEDRFVIRQCDGVAANLELGVFDTVDFPEWIKEEEYDNT
jgi:hypothetical protein